MFDLGAQAGARGGAQGQGQFETYMAALKDASNVMSCLVQPKLDYSVVVKPPPAQQQQQQQQQDFPMTVNILHISPCHLYKVLVHLQVFKKDLELDLNPDLDPVLHLYRLLPIVLTFLMMRTSEYKN